MKLDFCVLCGITKNLHHHHVIPKVKGGTDDAENLITVCDKHHYMIHNMRQNADMYELARIGMKNAKARGVKFGRKRNYTPQQSSAVLEMRHRGDGYGTIAKAMGMSVGMVRRIISQGVAA